MAAATSVHSNAFNFSSYVQTGVDPRTGQYTIALKLPELKANALQGPDFELSLFYTPLNTEDSGFGKGWNMQLSQVRKTQGSEVVTLSSGETYQITDESDGQLLMREQKLKQFQLYREAPAEAGGAGRYRLVHRSGLVEVLEIMQSQQAEVALPIEMHSPMGHTLWLTHRDPFGPGSEPFLSVRDADDTLLEITRSANQVDIRCYPYGGDDGEPLARYRLALSQADKRVSDVILPTANQARWHLEYSTQGGLLCVSNVQTPHGGHEAVFYQDLGHEFPASAGRTSNLPRVTRHETSPRFGQPAMVVTYEYPGTRNFIGGGSTIPWRDDGRDNLYQVGPDYTYQSVETQLGPVLETDDGPLQTRRIITRTFNRFHLLTLQHTQQGDNVIEAITEYGDSNGDFDAQPPQFQLPVTETTRWSLASESGKRRVETTRNSYDNQGNLLTRTQANNVVETQVWYSVAEEGYPGDGSGFVRHLKSRTVSPADTGHDGAARLKRVYRYKALQPLGAYLENPWLLVENEQLLDAGNADEVLEETQFLYYDQPSVPAIQYGRVRTRTVKYPAGEPGKTLDSVTAFSYELTGQGRALQSGETLTGYDGQRKSLTLEHDLQTGEPLLNRDDNDVEIRYVYDALRRVTLETVAPGTEYEASRRYQYFLCAYDNEQAQQWAQDVKQVQTRTLFDGLGRAIFEERQDTDSTTFAGAPRPIYRALYDEFGQLSVETEIDWLGDRLLELASAYHYDDWGEQYSVTDPDGVINVEQTDHLASALGPVRRAWRERDDRRDDEGKRIKLSGVVETHMNLFEKASRIERFGEQGQSVSVQVNDYDGLGRIRRQTLGSGAKQRVETFLHDPFDRLLEQRLADGNTVYRTYARHSTGDVPVSIRVGKAFESAILLGEQTFDGLDRRTSATTGGRLQKFSYDPGQRQPWRMTAADGTHVDYKYNPLLGEEPTWRVLAGTEANYTYDKLNARLTHCDEPAYKMDRTYFSHGEVKSETREVDGEPYHMSYSYSYRSRLRAYEDVQGQTQVNAYDDNGCLDYTELRAPSAPQANGSRRRPFDEQVLLRATFLYDELGRQQSITTLDLVDNQALTTTLDYDEFDRETLRTFEFADTVQTLEQGYDEFDCLEYRTLRERPKDGDEVQSVLLRHETYQYDLRGRLSRYDCEGPLAPVDPSGRTIAMQLFGFDAVDNITSVLTQEPGGRPVRTKYVFDGTDPAQLQRIEPADAPPIDLEYDANGNLTKDEQGRQLRYDALNRLVSVTTPEGESQRYHYDPENILSGTSAVSDSAG